MDTKEIADLLGAASRMALLQNQLETAQSRLETKLGIGFNGGLFMATDEFLAVLEAKKQIADRELGVVVLDMNRKPIGFDPDQFKEFYDQCLSVNHRETRAYLIEYTKIVSASKEQLVRGEVGTE